MSEKLKERIAVLRGLGRSIFEIGDELGLTSYAVLDVVAQLPDDPVVAAWQTAVNRRYGIA